MNTGNKISLYKNSKNSINRLILTWLISILGFSTILYAWGYFRTENTGKAFCGYYIEEEYKESYSLYKIKIDWKFRPDTVVFTTIYSDEALQTLLKLQSTYFLKDRIINSTDEVKGYTHD